MTLPQIRAGWFRHADRQVRDLVDIMSAVAATIASRMSSRMKAPVSWPEGVQGISVISQRRQADRCTGTLDGAPSGRRLRRLQPEPLLEIHPDTVDEVGPIDKGYAGSRRGAGKHGACW